MILCGEHAVLYGYPIISLAINQRLTVKSFVNKDDKIYIKSKFGSICIKNADLNQLNQINIPLWLKPIIFLLQNIKHSGLNIKITSNIDEYGFGSSGAVFSCICCSLLLLNNKSLTKEKLLKTTLDMHFLYQKKNIRYSSGIDIITNIVGGIVYYNPDKKIIKNLSNKIFEKYKIFAIWTGHKTSTTVTADIANNINDCKKIYKEIGIIVEEIYQLFSSNNNLNFLSINSKLYKNQILLEKLNLIDNDIVNIIEQCRKQNVIAKISGSGLGDCIIAICEKNKKFKIQNYKKIEINIDYDGIKYEFK